MRAGKPRLRAAPVFELTVLSKRLLLFSCGGSLLVRDAAARWQCDLKRDKRACAVLEMEMPAEGVAKVWLAVVATNWARRADANAAGGARVTEVSSPVER